MDSKKDKIRENTQNVQLVLSYSRTALVSRPLFEGLGLVLESIEFSPGLFLVSDKEDLFQDQLGNNCRATTNFLCIVSISCNIITVIRCKTSCKK